MRMGTSLCLRQAGCPAPLTQIASAPFDDWKETAMARWQKNGRPKNAQVSMRGETYELLKTEAQRHGMNGPKELLEFIIDCFFTEQSITPRRTGKHTTADLEHRDKRF